MPVPIEEIKAAYQGLKNTILESGIVEVGDDDIEFLGASDPYVTDSVPTAVELAESGAGLMGEDWFADTAQLYKAAGKTTQLLNELRMATINIIAGISGTLSEEEFYSSIAPARISEFAQALGNILADEYFLNTDAGADSDDGKYGDLNDLIAPDTWMVSYSPPDTIETGEGEKYLLQVFNELLEETLELDEFIVLPPVYLSRELRASPETEDFGGAVILSDRALELSLGEKINTGYSYYIGFRLNETMSSDKDGDPVRSNPYVPARHSPYYNLDGPLTNGWDEEKFSYLDNSEETKNLREESIPDANGAELELGTPVVVTEIVEGASGMWVGFIPITDQIASYYGAIVPLEEELTDGYKKVLYTRPQYIRKLEALSNVPDPLVKYKAWNPRISEIFGQKDFPPVELKDGTKLISESGNFNWTSMEPMDVRLSYFNFNKYNEEQAKLVQKDLIINKETIDEDPKLAFSEGHYYFIVGEGNRPTVDEIVQEEEEIPDETPYDDSMILYEGVDEELEEEKAKKSRQVSDQIKYDTFSQLLRYFGRDETETDLLAKIREKYFAPVSSRVNTRTVSPNNQQVLYALPASYIDSLPASKKIYNNIFPDNSEFLGGNNYAFTIELGLLQERTDQIIAIFENMKEKIKAFEADGGVIKNPYDLPYDLDTQIKSLKAFPKIIEDFLSRQGYPRSTDYDEINILASNGVAPAKGTRHLLQIGVKDNGLIGENVRETISYILFSPDPKILEKLYVSPESKRALFEFEPYISDEEMKNSKNARRSAMILKNGLAYLRRQLAGNIASDSAGSIAIGKTPESSLYGTRTLHYMMFSEALIKYKKSVDTKPDFETKDWVKVLQAFSVPPLKIYLSKDRALKPEEITCEEIIEKLNKTGPEVGPEEKKLQEMLFNSPICMEKYYSRWSKPTPATDGESSPAGLQDKLEKLEDSSSNPKHMARFKVFYNAVLNSLDPQGLMALLMMCLQKQLGVEITAKALCEIAIIKMIEADPAGFKEILINASPDLAMALGFATASEAYLGNEANAVVEKYKDTGQKQASAGGDVNGVSIDESFAGAPIATAMKLNGEGSQLVSVIKSLEQGGTYIDLVPGDRPEEYGEIIIPHGLPGNVAPYGGTINFGFGEGAYEFAGTVPQKYTWDEINAERKRLEEKGYTYSQIDGLLVQNGFLDVKYTQYEPLLSGGTFLEPIGEIAYNINSMLGVTSNDVAAAGIAQFTVDGKAVLGYIKKFVDLVTLCEAVLGPILEFPDALFSLNFEQFGDDWLARLKKHFVLQLPTLSLPWGMPTDDMIGGYGEKLLSAFLVMIGTMIGQILQLLIRDAIEKCFLEDIEALSGESTDEPLESEQLPKLKNALRPIAALPPQYDGPGWIDNLLSGLNPQEICSLLRGTAPNSLLRSLVLKTRDKHYDIYNHGYGSGEDIQSIFKKVGETFNLDFCNVVEAAPQKIVVDTCDISYNQEERLQELMDNGLTEEEADTQMLLEIEDLKDKLGALSDFIFPDSNPLKLPNLCGKDGIFQPPPGILDTMDRVTSNILLNAKGSLLQDLRAFKFFTMPNRALRAISSPEELMQMHETYINTVKAPNKAICFAYVGPLGVKSDGYVYPNKLNYSGMPNYQLTYNEHVHYQMIMRKGQIGKVNRFALPTASQVKSLEISLDLDEDEVTGILDGDTGDWFDAKAWSVEIVEDGAEGSEYDSVGYKSAYDDFMGNTEPSGIGKTYRNSRGVLNEKEFKFLTVLGVLKQEFDGAWSQLCDYAWIYTEGLKGITGFRHYSVGHQDIPGLASECDDNTSGCFVVDLGAEGVAVWDDAVFEVHNGISPFMGPTSIAVLQRFCFMAASYEPSLLSGGTNALWKIITGLIKNYLYDREKEHEVIANPAAVYISARSWTFRIEDIWDDLQDYFWEQWDQEIRPMSLERLYYTPQLMGVGVADESGAGPATMSTRKCDGKDLKHNSHRGRCPYGLPLGPTGIHNEHPPGEHNVARPWLNKLVPLHTRLKDISDDPDHWAHMFDFYTGFDLEGEYDWDSDTVPLNAFIFSPGYRKLASSPFAEEDKDMREVFMELTVGEATGITYGRMSLLYPNINMSTIKGVVFTMAPFQAKLVSQNTNGYYYNSTFVPPEVGNVLKLNTYIQWMERYHAFREAQVIEHEAGWGYYPHWDNAKARGTCEAGEHGLSVVTKSGVAFERDEWYKIIAMHVLPGDQVMSGYNVLDHIKPITDPEMLKQVHWKVFDKGDFIPWQPAPKVPPVPAVERESLEAKFRIAVNWDYSKDCPMRAMEDGHYRTWQLTSTQNVIVLASIDWYPGFEGKDWNLETLEMNGSWCSHNAMYAVATKTPGFGADGELINEWPSKGNLSGVYEPSCVDCSVPDSLLEETDWTEYDKYTTWGVHFPGKVWPMGKAWNNIYDPETGEKLDRPYTKQQLWDIRQYHEGEGELQIATEASAELVAELAPGELSLNIGPPKSRDSYQIVPLMIGFEQFFRDPNFLFNQDPNVLANEFLGLNRKTSPELWEALGNEREFFNLFKSEQLLDESYIDDQKNFNPNVLLYELPFVEVAVKNVGSADASADIVDLFNNLNSTDSDMEAVTSRLQFINEPKNLVYQNVQVPLHTNIHKLELEEKFHLFKSKIGNLSEQVPPAILSGPEQAVEPITYDFGFSKQYSTKVTELLNNLFPINSENGSMHDEVYTNLEKLSEAVKEEEATVWARRVNPAHNEWAPKGAYTINPNNFQAQIFAKLLRTRFQEYYSEYGGTQTDDPFFDKLEYTLATYGYSGLKYAYSNQMFARLYKSRLHEVKHYRSLWKELLKTPETDSSVSPECAAVFDQLSIVSTKDLKKTETDLFNIENVKQSIKEYYKNSICYDVFDQNTDAENSVTRSLKQGIVMLIARVYSLEMCLASVIAWDSFDLEDIVRDNTFSRIIVRNIQNEIKEYDDITRISEDIIKKQNNYKHFQLWENLNEDSALNQIVVNEASDIAKKVSNMIGNIFPDKYAKAKTGLSLNILKNSDPDFINKYKNKFPHTTASSASPTSPARRLMAEDIASLYSTYEAEYVVECELTDNLYTMNFGHCFQVDPLRESLNDLAKYAKLPASHEILNITKKEMSDFGLSTVYSDQEGYEPGVTWGSVPVSLADWGDDRLRSHQNNVLYSLPLTLMYVNDIGDLSADPNLTEMTIGVEQYASPQLYGITFDQGAIDHAVPLPATPAFVRPNRAIHFPLLYQMHKHSVYGPATIYNSSAGLSQGLKSVYAGAPHEAEQKNGDMARISRFANPRKITNNYGVGFDAEPAWPSTLSTPGHNIRHLAGSYAESWPSDKLSAYYFVEGVSFYGSEGEGDWGNLGSDHEWWTHADPKRRLSTRMWDKLRYATQQVPEKACTFQKENIHEFTWANGYNMQIGNMIIQTFVKVTERDPSTYDQFRLLTFADLDLGDFTATGEPCATPGKTIKEVGAAEALSAFMAEFENYRSGDNEFRTYIYDYIPLPVWCHFFKNVFMASIYKSEPDMPPDWNVDFEDIDLTEDEQYQNIKYLFNRYGLKPFFEKVEFGLRFSYINSYGLTEPPGIGFRNFMKDTMPVNGLKKCKTLFSNRVSSGLDAARSNAGIYDEVHIPITEVKQTLVFEPDGFRIADQKELYDYDEIAYGNPDMQQRLPPTWFDDNRLTDLGEKAKHYTNTFSQFFYKKVASNLMSRLENTAEFKLLFDHIFPLKRYMSLAFIYAGDGLTKFIPEPTAILEETKSALQIAMTGLTNSDSYEYQPDPLANLLENRQIRENAGTAGKEPDLTKQILEILYKTPLLILKGFVEVTDPAIIIAKAIIDAANAIVQSVIAAVEQGLKMVKQGIQSAIQQAKSTLSSIESNLSVVTGQVKAAKIPLQNVIGENIDEVIILKIDGAIVSDEGAKLWEIRINQGALTDEQKETLKGDASWKNIKKLIGEASPMIDDYAALKIKIVDLETELAKVEEDLKVAIAEAKKIAQAVFSSPFLLPGLWAALLPSMLPYLGGVVPPPFFIGPPSTIPGMIYLLLLFLDAYEEKMHEVVEELDTLGCTDDI